MDRRGFLKNVIALAVPTGAGVWMLGSTPGKATALNLLRPPGALPETDFLSRCLRCMRCVDACPNHAIVSLDDAFGLYRQSTPAIVARRQACMLCSSEPGKYLRCTQACPSGALELIEKDLTIVRVKVNIGKAKIDEALCYSYTNWTCGACYRACPLPGKAMTLGMWERPTVHQAACVGCGLCERACIRYPQAIRVRGDRA